MPLLPLIGDLSDVLQILAVPICPSLKPAPMERIGQSQSTVTRLKSGLLTVRFFLRVR
jgi:hypothetical protein